MGNNRNTAIVLNALSEKICSIQELTVLVGNSASARTAIHRLKRWGWQIAMTRHTRGKSVYHIIDSNQKVAAGKLSEAQLSRRIILPPKNGGR